MSSWPTLCQPRIRALHNVDLHASGPTRCLLHTLPVAHVACCTRCLLHTLNRAHLCQALIRGFSYVIRNRYIAKRIPPHPRSASVTLDSYATDAYRHISTPPGTKI